MMKWLKWAVGEAGSRTASMTLQNVIGRIAGSFPLVVISTLMIGIVQCSTAFGIVRRKQLDIFPSRRLVTGSVLFGIGAFVNTLLAFMAYVYDANMAVYTMITLLAIIPGAIIDRIWFNEKITLRLIAGIILATIAGWLILDLPNLESFTDMPVWTWIGLGNAIGLSINQGITRWSKEVNPWVKNFWGGSTTAILCLLTVLIFADETIRAVATADMGRVLGWSAVISFLVIGIWSFNVIAYRDGAAIPTKQVVVNGIFLTLTIFAGYLFFGDMITSTQFGGMVVYLIAFTVMNKEAWEYITRTQRVSSATR